MNNTRKLDEGYRPETSVRFLFRGTLRTSIFAQFLLLAVKVRENSPRTIEVLVINKPWNILLVATLKNRNPHKNILFKGLTAGQNCTIGYQITEQHSLPFNSFYFHPLKVLFVAWSLHSFIVNRKGNEYGSLLTMVKSKTSHAKHLKSQLIHYWDLV